MNIRLVLAGAALGALTAGSLYAQDQTVVNHRVADGCDRAHPSRTPRACDRAARAWAYYRAHPYAQGYYQGYPTQAYYSGYDDSDYYGPYGQPADGAYYAAPPPSAYDYGAPAAYEAPAPDVAPVVVPARRFWWERPGETSPAAQYSVRLHGYVNPHTSVTAIPTPNNVSDQIPSHGFDYDGVPPYYPY
ncbi:MAG TPA: hypothetical protein VGF42_07510 [Caulobacteraceae bacterium]